MDVSSSLYWYGIIPLIIIGAVILGVIFLVIIGLLVSRRVSVDLKVGGAITLTLASIILLSGFWCMFLSPTASYSHMKDSFYRQVSVTGSGEWIYSFDVERKNILSGSINFAGSSLNVGGIVNVSVIDPDGEVVWFEKLSSKSAYVYFNLKALKSGVYQVRISNLIGEDVPLIVQVKVYEKVAYRPLEPLGQWLSLISLPIFGLGIWASDVISALRRGRI